MNSSPYAGIVLCGGHSRRMGKSKAWLPFGEETMLQRVVRILSSVVPAIVVVAAREQDLPPLPSEVIVVRDAEESRGPLEGLLAGLSVLPSDCMAAFVTSCDVPLLVPALVTRMFELAAGFEVTLPVENEDGSSVLREHPLCAVYRPSIAPQVQQLLAANQRRLLAVAEVVKTRRVEVQQLRDVDPELRSLRNLNTQAEYLAALAEIGRMP